MKTMKTRSTKSTKSTKTVKSTGLVIAGDLQSTERFEPTNAQMEFDGVWHIQMHDGSWVPVLEQTRGFETPEYEPSQPEPKQEVPKKSGTKMRTMVDGVMFNSLSEAMAHVDPKEWGKHNDYRASHWNRLNRMLKKGGAVEYRGHLYILI
jgi:hypothetical protein